MTGYEIAAVIASAASGAVALIQAVSAARRKRQVESYAGALAEHEREHPEVVSRIKKTAQDLGSRVSLGEGWITTEAERATRRLDRGRLDT